MTDQRAFARYAFMGVIKCFASFRVNGQHYTHQPVLNLSAGGMLVWLDEPIKKFERGESLHDIQLELDSLANFQIEGQVVRLMPVRTALGCGVQFLDLPEQQADEIVRFLRHGVIV